ncbi:unnamed protein product [Ectocarpus sp. CCAP 1310/34]|nr:unnamed protein product [Ectocarpus sp. CCAP 1310/34]
MVNQPPLSALCGNDGVKQMGAKKTKKGRGSRKRNIDVDPAQQKVTIATWNGHRGRGGRTSTPPESQEGPAQPPRRPSSLTSGTTPLTTTTTSTKTTTARAAQRERDGAVGAAGRNRYPAASGRAQAPLSGKTKPPLTLEELSEGMLTQEAIRVAAGKATTRQLRDVSRLQIVIDSSMVSIEGVWDAVPKLHTLTLDGSRLESFRDLGVGLRHLNTLSLESSCVEDLDGIGALSGLRELRLARNQVSDVTPLACHGCLQVLGLERNRVNDMKALEILSSLPLLYSLNLSQNPLTESLSKLRDGRGRGVVRQLIPQIRVLDGIHLSSGEGGAVDAQTLDEAVDLICRDASRARAAWSEEGVTEVVAAAAAVGAASTATTIKVVQQDRWRPDGVGKDECLPLAGLNSCFPRSPTKPGVATVAGLGGGGSPIPPQLVPGQGGGIHWDSDLTQGGRQALSGNPSSAIRRHQCRGGTGNGRNEDTPTRVLETLDLAKVMERGLKQRHSTQQSADRVSEWRRETSSDSVPREEDPSYEPLDGTAPPSPLVLEAIPLSSSSAVDGGFDRRARLIEGGRKDSGILAPKATTTWASSTTSVANPPKSSAAAAAAAADDGVRKTLSTGKGGTRASSGRPWTSEGVFGASSRGGGTASATNQRRAPPGQERHWGAAGDDRGESGGRRRGGEGEPEARSHRRRRRPQTAKEAPGKRCMNGGLFDGEQDEMFRNYRNASWQPVWESLQTARLISSPRLFQTTNTSVAAPNPAAAAGVERGDLGGGPATQAGDGARWKIGSVDFGRQRRARATVRASRGGDDANYLDLDETDGASSARDEGEGAESSGGDDSQEADDRTEIKKRASGFCSPASKASVGSGIASRLSTSRSRGVPTSSSSPSAVLPAEAAAVASSTSAVACEWKNEATPQQPGDKPVEGNSSGRQPPKARRREAVSSFSWRPLKVMDDTSSSGGGSDNNSSEDDGGCCVRRAFKLAAPGRKMSVRHTEDGRRGSCSGVAVGVGARAAVGSDGGGRDGDSSSITGGFRPSPNRVTSVHASRKLGFDLKRSLAAIEEWTDKTPAGAIIGGGNHCANTPRQEAPNDSRKNQPAPFFVEHTPSLSPSPRGTAPFSSPPVKSNSLAVRESKGGGCLSSAVISDSSMMPQTIDHRSRAKATVVPDIIGIARTDDGDDDGDDDGEPVLSVAAARAALGMSKGLTAAATSTTPRSGRAWVAPTPAEIDALTAEGIDGRVGLVPSSSATQACASKRNEYESRQAGSAGSLAGVAVGMCDEDLKEMLKKQPRMVPELRTKEHFREFFQGMGAERMERLLRGAYEDLSPDQVGKKVKKRLGLVGDKLAW